MPQRPVLPTDHADGAALRRLLAGFVHEVNSALNPVLAAAFLLDQHADDPATVRDVAQKLRRGADALARQTRIVNGMLRNAGSVPAEARGAASASAPEAAASVVADPETSRRLASNPPAPIRVLVADDAPADRSLLEQVLGEFGYSVVAGARSGTEAVERARAATPDVVLLDVHMPDGNGVEAAARIRQALPDVAVVLFTGDDGLQLSDGQLEESDAIAFVPKPAAPRVLDASLRLAVRRAREMRAARAEAADARQQLANRKLIERAKGLLMERNRCSEAEAYRFLQKTSQNRAVPIVEIARLILEQDGRAEPGAAP